MGLNKPRETGEESDARKEELRLKYLPKFQMLRHEYIEVLPSQRISWDLPDYLKYKARGSFFTMIRADIEFLVTSGVITDTTVIAQGEEFARYMLEEHPYPEFTRMEDIQVANNILDVLITSLSGH